MTRREAFWAPLASLFGHGPTKDGPATVEGKRLCATDALQIIDGNRTGHVVVVWDDAREPVA